MSNSEQTTKAKQTAEKPKLTPEQREAQRKQALDDAAKKAVSSVTNLRAYLAVQSRFERYSTNNNLLIFAQRPDATRLKSLELWNKEKKWIREGAKAVAIYEPVRKQGKENGIWVILDYGEIVVHVFQSQYRDFYRLEDLWADAKRTNFTD